MVPHIKYIPCFNPCQSINGDKEDGADHTKKIAHYYTIDINFSPTLKYLGWSDWLCFCCIIGYNSRPIGAFTWTHVIMPGYTDTKSVGWNVLHLLIHYTD
jgi:hypothetical protein